MLNPFFGLNVIIHLTENSVYIYEPLPMKIDSYFSNIGASLVVCSCKYVIILSLFIHDNE